MSVTKKSLKMQWADQERNRKTLNSKKKRSSLFSRINKRLLAQTKPTIPNKKRKKEKRRRRKKNKSRKMALKTKIMSLTVSIQAARCSKASMALAATAMGVPRRAQEEAPLQAPAVS